MLYNIMALLHIFDKNAILTLISRPYLSNGRVYGVIVVRPSSSVCLSATDVLWLSVRL